MTAQIYTATSGQVIRDFAASHAKTDRVSIFPESGRTASEQAAFLKENANNFDVIITLSPFIVSDSERENLHILDLDRHNIKQGDSINKVTMNLWHRRTVGDIVDDKIDAIRNEFKDSENVDQLNSLTDRLYELGDSIERHCMVTEVIRKIKELEKR